MQYILGIDTGGTYTDCVIMDMRSKAVVCKAKSLTTKEDLSIGITTCLDKMDGFPYSKIGLVSLSTTLATNAIVEGKGRPTGLILVDKELRMPFPTDMVYFVGGCMDIKGREQERIDTKKVDKAINYFKDKVEAIAVSGYSSVRNPKSELFIKNRILERLDIPVVCAHTLTSQLGFYERTVTSVLNAMLIPIISNWLLNIKDCLLKCRITAPVMVVKSDGSYMQSSMAIEKPIETILSGPAASIHGGKFLTGIKSGIILDIGGTTTDMARINDGNIKINYKGATIGKWSTHIKATDIVTFGLGGDSLIRINSNMQFSIGPEKVTPFCFAGEKFPSLFDEIKKRSFDINNDSMDWVYVIKNSSNCYPDIRTSLINLMDKPRPMSFFVKEQSIPESLIEKLVKSGVLGKIGLTPTDILHVLGKYSKWDSRTSKLIMKQISHALNINEESLVLKIRDKICLDIFKNTNKVDTIVAIGAPAKTWMREVMETFNCDNYIVPVHYEVANAIGAAVGQITESVSALIRYDKILGKYIIHGPFLRECADTLDEAKNNCMAMLQKAVCKAIEKAGSNEYKVIFETKDIYVDINENKEKAYIETRMISMAIGELLGF